MNSRGKSWFRVCSVIVAIVAGASAASAKLPDPSRCSVPRFIDVVGDAQGTPDARGRFTVTIRDFVNNPEPFVSVQFLLATGCSDTRLCSVQANGGTADCSNGMVTAMTGMDGTVTLTITGAADDMGTAIPPAVASGAGTDCIRIYADGIVVGNATAVVYDVNGRSTSNGNPGVNGLDLSIVKLEVGAAGLGAPYRGRCDYTHDSRIDGADLAQFKEILGSGASMSNCAAVCP